MRKTTHLSDEPEKLIVKMLNRSIEYNYKIIYYIELVDDFVTKLKEKYKQHS